MAVIILHPTDELKLVNFQKELISMLFEEGRIMIAQKPLWIKFGGGFDTLAARAFNHRIELGDLEVTAKEIFIPVTITTDTASYNSRLKLINLHSGKAFSGFDRQKLSEKKQPVRQLKVFRLGEEKELSSNSKCITESKWIKLR